MDKVREVCERAIWIEGGRVAASGTTEEAIQAYYSYVSQTSAAHA
jgi:ABC-type polysaccharide/polyol phosphate transport system ATPase subunit